MKKLVALALTVVAAIAIASPILAVPEDHTPQENPLSTFRPSSLGVSCGSQLELERFISEEGEQVVLKGRSFSPSTSESPVIMTMNKHGGYTLYAINPKNKSACIIDFGQMIVKDLKES